MDPEIQVQTDSSSQTTAPDPTPAATAAPAPAVGDTPQTQPEPINPSPAAADVDPEAMSAEEYASAVAKFRAGEEPQGQAPADPTADEPPAEPAPTGDEPPTAEPTADPEPPKPAADPEPDAKGDFRPRLGKLPDRQKEVVALVKKLSDEGKAITFAEAEKRVNALYGDVEPTDTPPAPAQPKVSDIDAKINDLRAQRKEAAKIADTEKIVELDDAIDAAKSEREQAQRAEADAEQTRAEVYARDVQASKDKARQYFPAIADKAGALSQKFDELLARYEADPVLKEFLDAPDAPWRLTVAAANELGIAPVDPKAAKPAAPKTPPSSPPPHQPQPRPAIQPASGAARSVQPNSPIGQLEAELDAAKSADDYDKVKEKYLAATA